MCRFLGLTRSLYYYKPTPHKIDIVAENAVIKTFNENKKVYGTIKIKKELAKNINPINISRRKIGRIMNKYGLISKYIKKHKKHKSVVINQDNAPNIINRDFKPESHSLSKVIVSDLTYVKVNSIWHYVCLLLDLSNREIIGYAAGRKKDSELVKQAFYRAKIDLRNIDVFHTDRGRFALQSKSRLQPNGE